MKFKDILRNNRVSLVTDEFDADWLHGRGTTRTDEKAVVINGRASIFSEGRIYLHMYHLLRNKYPDYKAEKSWMPGEIPNISNFIRQGCLSGPSVAVFTLLAKKFEG